MEEVLVPRQLASLWASGNVPSRAVGETRGWLTPRERWQPRGEVQQPQPLRHVEGNDLRTNLHLGEIYNTD